MVIGVRLQCEFGKIPDIDALMGYLHGPPADDPNQPAPPQVKAAVLDRSLEAIDVILPTLARIFNVPLLDPETGVGCTALQLIGLMNQFIDYTETLKKSTEPTPSSQPSTDSSLEN